VVLSGSGIPIYAALCVNSFIKPILHIAGAGGAARLVSKPIGHLRRLPGDDRSGDLPRRGGHEGLRHVPEVGPVDRLAGLLVAFVSALHLEAVLHQRLQP